MRKFFLISFLFLSFLLAGMVQARAQAQDHLYRSVYRLTFLDQWRAMLRSGFMAGSGYATGYMDYLIPVLQNDRSLVFFTPKASFTDDDSNEQNIGVGYRYLNYAESLILGGNVFFDTRRSVYRNRFNQVGAGLEFLTKWIDARVNGYFPTTDEKRIPAQDTYALGQEGLLRYGGFEEPLSGLDYELGFLIPGVSNVMETRLYVGGYRYDSRKFEDVIGERLRLEIMPTRFMTLEMKADIGHDGHTYCSYGGFVTLPLDIGNIFRLKNPFEGWGEMVGYGRGPREMTERMTDRVVRDLDIVRKVGTAKNPVTYKEMIYVDNSNVTGTEDGTREHPYNTLAEAFTDVDYGEGSWIYVNKGDGTATGYTGNYALADSVVLWGSGYDGGFAGVTAVGHPVIDGTATAGDTITLADDNTVMGLKLDHAADDAISSSATTRNANINHNIIAHSFNKSLNFVNNSPEDVAWLVTDNTITDNNRRGVNYYNDAYFENDGGGSMRLDFLRNVSSVPTMAYNDLIDVYALGSGAVVCNIKDNVFDGGLYPVDLLAYDNVSMTAEITGNTIMNSSRDGAIYMQTDAAASLNALISRNTFTNNGLAAIEVISFGGSSIALTISDNTISDAGSGVSLWSAGNSFFDAVVSGNIISNMSTGIGLYSADSSSLTATISGNRIDEADYGMDIEAWDSGVLTAAVTGDTITGSSENGVSFYVFNDAALNANFSGNHILNNNVGVYLYNNAPSITPVIDFGGGSLNSSGNNSIYDNIVYNVQNALAIAVISAQNNWWGTSTPDPAKFSGSVDYTHPLERAP